MHQTRYGGPIFVEGRITGAVYRETVQPALFAAIKQLYAAADDDSIWVFMQDGAGPHTAEPTQRQLREQKDCDFWSRDEWPGNSSDLNPVEGFWAILQACVSPRGACTTDPHVLKVRVRCWFAERRVAACRRALRGMRQRMVELEDADFEVTPH